MSNQQVQIFPCVPGRGNAVFVVLSFVNRLQRLNVSVALNIEHRTFSVAVLFSHVK